MISNLNYLADQFVFYNLKKIRYGYLQIIDSKGKEHFFGDSKSNLKAKLKINSPGFSLKLLTKAKKLVKYIKIKTNLPVYS